MPYCTKQNLIDRYSESELIQLTDRAAQGVIDDTVLDRCIADADGEIDGYLSPKYGAPLAVVPKAIERIACAITRYYLYDDNVTDQVATLYKDAIAFLKGVANGTISIGIDAVGAKPTKSSNTVQMESGGREFGRDKNGYI